MLAPWFKVALVVSIFGVLKDFRPSEPYIYEFLTGPEWRNLSGEDVQQYVYPVATYSYMVLLIFVFFITDYLRYKPLITASGVSAVIIWCLLLWTKSLFMVQVLEVFYGFFMAAEVAYSTYIYAKVSKEHYQAVTSITRVALLFGRFISSATAQVLVYYEIMNMKDLNYLTLCAMVLATLWSLLLPSVPESLYFHQANTKDLSLLPKCKVAFKLLWSHVKTSYGSLVVLKWSLWWALSTCGYLQVESYVQPLWHSISPEDKSIYNASITATLTLLGAAMAVLAGMFKINWTKWGEFALTVCSVVGGVALLVCATTTNIWVCYCGYILFGVLFQLMITVATGQVASNIPDDSYGLIFGINTLLALVFQTGLIQVVVSDNGWALDSHDQYLVYGGYHIFIGGVFVLFGILKIFCRRNN